MRERILKVCLGSFLSPEKPQTVVGTELVQPSHIQLKDEANTVNRKGK
jgi:hypothetical protein